MLRYLDYAASKFGYMVLKYTSIKVQRGHSFLSTWILVFPPTMRLCLGEHLPFQIHIQFHIQW